MALRTDPQVDIEERVSLHLEIQVLSVNLSGLIQEFYYSHSKYNFILLFKVENTSFDVLLLEDCVDPLFGREGSKERGIRDAVAHS